jgi:flagellar basal body-associated protein FliL
MADKAEKPEKAEKAEKAEKPDKKGEPAPEKKAAAPEKHGGLMSRTPVLIGGVMLIEAVVLIGGFKFVMGGPKNANGADLTTSATTQASKSDGDSTGGAADSSDATAELSLVDFKAMNRLSGRALLYDVSIFVSVKSEHQDAVQQKIKDREALIKDRIRTIIAEIDPEKLGGSEPGLETLRRQVKYQLDEIIGDGMIEEVLVPRCIPYRTDF